jgi:hypothetical protein
VSEVRVTAEQVESILAALRREMLLPGAMVDAVVEAGAERRDNWNTRYVETAPNGTRTFTVTVRVNGGARDNVGEPIR